MNGKHGKVFGILTVAIGLAALAFMGMAEGAHGANALPASILRWGSIFASDPIPVFGTDVVAVAAGDIHFVTLTRDGAVTDSASFTAASGNDFKAVAAGTAHGLALRSNGTVAAWGNNEYGQCNVPATLGNVVAIAAHGNHSLALDKSGRVYAWGSSNYGESKVPSLGTVKAIACGNNFSMALLENGQVVVWGWEAWDVQPPPGLVATAIAAGGSHCLAIRPNGTVVGWGDNTYGGTTPPAGLSNVVAIACGEFHSLALTTSGKVVGWGSDGYGGAMVPAGLSHVTCISACVAYSLAVAPRAGLDPAPLGKAARAGETVKLTAGVYGVPSPACQWLKDGAPIDFATGTSLTLTNVHLASAGDYSLVLSNSYGMVTSYTAYVLVSPSAPGFASPLADQSVVEGDNVVFDPQSYGSAPTRFQWFFNGAALPGATNSVLSLTHVSYANAGKYGVTIYNPSGSASSRVATLQIGPSAPRFITQPQDQNVIAGSMVRFHASVAGTRPMTYQWFMNGQPVDGATNDTLFLANVGPTYSTPQRYTVLASNVYGSVLSSPALLRARVAGSPVIWSRDGVSGLLLTNLVDIKAKNGFCLGLTADGRVVEWLGDHPYFFIDNLTDVVEISAGAGHGLALKKDGTVVTWGSTGPIIATVPEGISNVVAISAGWWDSMVLTRDGTVAAWGYDTLGETVVPRGLDHVVAVAAGDIESYAVRDDGSIWAWGYVDRDHLGIPSAATNTVSIVAENQDEGMALSKEGTVTVWGSSHYNLPQIPDGLAGVVDLANAGAGAEDSIAAALKEDGTLALWGDSSSGLLTPPSWLKDVTAVSCEGTFFAVLTRQPVFVTQPPAHSSCVVETNITLSATVASSTSASYQWQHEGVDVPGATNVELCLTDVQTNDSGCYVLCVSNAFGMTQSAAAALDVVLSPPSVYSIWIDGSCWVGSNVTIRTSLSGLKPMGCQWFFEGQPIAGATGETLNLVNLQLTNAGTYSVVVTNAHGTGTGQVSLDVVGPPGFVDAGKTLTVPASTNVQITATVLGGWVYSYQWYHGQQPIIGAVSGSLTISNVQEQAAGQYFLVASNYNGVSTGLVANLVVTPVAPVIAQQPTNQTVLANTRARFSVAAVGSEPMGYQWQFNGTDLPGETGATLTIDHVQSGNVGQYAVLVRNAANTTKSQAASLAVQDSAPVFLNNPLKHVVKAGGTVEYEVSVAASAPVSYQWRRNGVDIPGATNLTLTLTNLAIEHEGAYSIYVSNALGTASSLSGDLTVLLPGIVVQWGSTSMTRGLDNVVAVALGDSHFLALRADGTVAAWGDNSYGKTNLPANLTNVAAIAAGDEHSLALKADGTVVAWGANYNGQTNVPPGLSNVVGIACGSVFCLALQQNGKVVAWGDGFDTTVPSNLEDVTAIAAGEGGAAALTRSGNVVCWNWSSPSVVAPIPSLSNIVAIAAGRFHVLALRSDGLVFGVDGSTWRGEGIVPDSATNVVNISAGLMLSIAQRRDGSFIEWGDPIGRVPATLGGVEALAANYNGNSECMAVTRSPMFASDPVSPAVLVGSTVALQAEAVGTPPLRYQWYRSGQPIPAATNSTLTLEDMQSEQAGAYSVTVNNGFGTNSESFSVSVQTPPSFVTQLTNQWVPSGRSAILCPVVTGPGPMSYQWQRNGTNLPGAISAALILSNLKPSDSGIYRVIVSNACGATASEGACLSVGSSQVLTVQDGGSAFLDSGVYLPGSGSYQWLLNGAPIQGATSRTLVLKAITSGLAGSYSIVVSNGTGVVTNAITQVSVLASGPVFVTEPISRFAAVGSSFWLECSVIGSGPLTYQWYFNGAQIPGATDQKLFFGSVQTNVSGVYSVEVCNANGTNTSAGALINVIETPSVAITPGYVDVPSGSTVRFSTSVAGTPPLSYQWFKNGTAVPGETNSSLVLSDVYQDGLAFTVAVSNRVGSFTSLPSMLHVRYEAPAILVPLSDSGIMAGADVLLSVTAEGSLPLKYQWYFNNQEIYGATNATFGLTNFQGESEGSYSVLVYNTYGSTSSVANISWNRPASVIVTPDNQLVGPGRTATFKALASGLLPLSFQWQLNGTNLPCATNAEISITNLQACNAGDYSVIVSNGFSSATASAHLDIADWPPLFVFPLISHARTVGESTRFRAQARGLEPLTYQWKFNDADMPGETNDTLVLTNLALIQSGTYTLLVRDAAENASCSSATLRVLPPTTLVYWGSPFSAEAPDDLTNAVALSVGSFHALALRGNGTVVAWGDNRSGQCNVPPGLSNVVAVSASENHNLALKDDGSVIEWGGLGVDGISTPASIPPAVAIAAGSDHEVCLLADGTIFSWGTDYYGETHAPSDLTDIVQVSAGLSQSFSLDSSGTATAWGAMKRTLPGSYSALSSWGSTQFGLKINGTVVWNGSSPCVQANIPVGLANVVQVAAGGQHGAALRQDGTVVCWGANDSGQTNVPSGLTNVVHVAGGLAQTFALVGGPAIIFTTQPVSQSIGVGQDTTFSVVVRCAAPVQYQWKFNNSDIPNATNAMLLVSNVTLSSAGDYCVSVRDASGQVQSLAAHLDVIARPLITLQPTNQTAWVGASLLFTAEATGRGPLTYQWQLNGVDLPGKNSPSLAIDNAQLAQSGSYTVRVSNMAGSTPSQPAQLTLVNASVLPATMETPSHSPAGISLQFTVEPGYDYSVQVSDDLIHWDDLSHFNSGGSNVSVSDPSATNAVKRFYRVRSP